MITAENSEGAKAFSFPAATRRVIGFRHECFKQAAKKQMTSKRFPQFVLTLAVGIVSFSLRAPNAHAAALSVTYSSLPPGTVEDLTADGGLDRKSTRLNSTHG